MEDIFDTCNGKSPVKQDFIWLGSYYDGSYLSEFDFNTQKPNSFYSLKQAELMKFGLIGHGMKLFFDSLGTFTLNGRVIDFTFLASNAVYELTGKNKKSLEPLKIITYKDAHSSINASQVGEVKNSIDAYSFGYETKIRQDDTSIGLKVVGTLPYKEPMHLKIKITSNKSIQGSFNILYDQNLFFAIRAIVDKQSYGELTWIVR
jgi:hypothetical protein